MRNRRFTVSVIMTLALVATPKVWQKLNDLVAAVQHKAHATFVEMALNSQAREYGEKVLTTVSQSGESVASCTDSQFEKVLDGSWTVSVSRVRSVRAKRRATANSSSEAETLAFNFTRRVEKQQPLEHVANVAENRLVMRAVAFAPPPASASKDDVAEVVTLPQSEQFPPVFVERDSELNIKVRKALDDAKAARQKVRLVIFKNNAAFPVS